MYCRECGKIMEPGDAVCRNCGVPAGVGRHFCPNCGKETNELAAVCTSCGVNLTPPQQQYAAPNGANNGYVPNNGYAPNGANGYAPNPGPNPGPYGAPYTPRSKVAAGILGILLGAFGVHNFYLGFTGKAVAQLLITVLSCGILSVVSAIWGLVEGIMILTTPNGVDARGVPLRD